MAELIFNEEHGLANVPKDSKSDEIEDTQDEDIKYPKDNNEVKSIENQIINDKLNIDSDYNLNPSELISLNETDNSQCVPDVYTILSKTYTRRVSAPASLNNLNRKRYFTYEQNSLDLCDENIFTLIDSPLLTNLEKNRCSPAERVKPNLLNINIPLPVLKKECNKSSISLSDSSTQTVVEPVLEDKQSQTDVSVFETLPNVYSEFTHTCLSSSVQCHLNDNYTIQEEQLTVEYRFIEGLGHFQFYGDTIIDAPQSVDDFTNSIPILRRPAFHEIFNRIQEIALKDSYIRKIWSYIPNVRGRPARPWDGMISSLDLTGIDAIRKLKVAYHLLDCCTNVELFGIYDDFSIENEL